VLESQSGPGGLHENTLLVVMGDHGQTLNGDHGGGSAEEVCTTLMVSVDMLYLINIYFPQFYLYDNILQVETAIFAMSFKEPLSPVPPEFDSYSCQIDLVFTIPLKFKTCINMLV
jgi:phosphatidylinositol glycan class O